MDLLDSLHELEDLVASSSRFLLTNKCLVNEEELIRLISNIRKEWPSALKEAEGHSLRILLMRRMSSSSFTKKETRRTSHKIF